METTTTTTETTQADKDWAIVREAMHYKGSQRDRFTSPIWTKAYLACDGFGKNITMEFACEQIEWDWSHVRDSTDEGLHAAAEIFRAALRKEQIAARKTLNELAENFAALTQRLAGTMGPWDGVEIAEKANGQIHALNLKLADLCEEIDCDGDQTGF